jgi:hypothetical protein
MPLEYKTDKDGKKVVDFIATIGRPTRCTHEVIEEICLMIMNGNYIITAVLASGISEKSYYNWIDRANKDEQQGLDAIDSIYVAFLQSTKIAHAYAESSLVEDIRHNKDAKSFQPLAWLLERTRQDKFGQKQQVDINHTVTARIESAPEPPKTLDEFLNRAIEQQRASAELQASATDVQYMEVDDGGE